MRSEELLGTVIIQFGSKKHQLQTVKANKLALGCFVEKKYIKDDRIPCLPLSYFFIEKLVYLERFQLMMVGEMRKRWNNLALRGLSSRIKAGYRAATLYDRLMPLEINNQKNWIQPSIYS